MYAWPRSNSEGWALASPVIESYPRAAHWTDWTYVPGLNPTAGLAALVRTATFPVDPNGDPLLPGVIDWGDLTPDTIVTSGTSTTHNYVAGVKCGLSLIGQSVGPSREPVLAFDDAEKRELAAMLETAGLGVSAAR